MRRGSTTSYACYALSSPLSRKSATPNLDVCHLRTKYGVPDGALTFAVELADGRFHVPQARDHVARARPAVGAPERAPRRAVVSLVPTPVPRRRARGRGVGIEHLGHVHAVILLREAVRRRLVFFADVCMMIRQRDATRHTRPGQARRGEAEEEEGVEVGERQAGDGHRFSFFFV